MLIHCYHQVSINQILMNQQKPTCMIMSSDRRTLVALISTYWDLCVADQSNAFKQVTDQSFDTLLKNVFRRSSNK